MTSAGGDAEPWTFRVTDPADPPHVAIEREVEWRPERGVWIARQRVDHAGWTARDLDWPAPADHDHARRIADENTGGLA